MQRDIDGDMRDAVGTRQHLDDVARGRRADGANIAADIDIGMSAQRDDAAIGVAGDLELALGLARMIGGEQILAPGLDPSDLPPPQTRGERDQEIFRIEFAARAEGSADGVLDQRYRVFGEAEMARENVAAWGRRLCRAA